jgi:transposase
LYPHCRREQAMDPRVAASPTATAPQSATLLVSFELSRRSWVLTVQPPGRARLSRFVVAACDTARVLAKLDEQRLRAERASGGLVRIVSIHEAGLDGFWLHRWLEVRGVESHVVDPASLLGSGRRKQAKTDRIDGEKLVRALALWLGGDRRACAMVRPPSPEQEDWRRLVRERDELIAARTRLCNRIDGLLANQGIVGFDPRHKEARASGRVAHRRWAGADGASCGGDRTAARAACAGGGADQGGGGGARCAAA